MNQLRLIALGCDEDADRGDELIRVVEAAVENIGFKEFAGHVGTSLSNLSHAFAGRNGRRVDPRWIPAAISQDPERRVARFLAEPYFDLTELDRRSDGEKLAALEEQVRKAGRIGEDMLVAAGLAAPRARRGR